MVAEAVGFMMSRAADGGAMAPELVTRGFLGGCQAPAADDDPRSVFSLRVLAFASSSSLLNWDWTGPYAL
ncbi:unnamed protein product [Triticum turgidum subsp. durum]|uniref:Uncharacterized protein n=1 Tax=Triticum turgidum subsp. durum TaxID=4567 RepID=A0A9R0SSP6_TRITD|nr:unnamed protein product [Triticum turgidum subsp. durum]